MEVFNWIHVSDVHIHDEDFDRDSVLSKFFQDVKNRSQLDPSLNEIHAVFFTGDLVFSGKEAEYELVYQELIEPLAQELGITNLSQHIFVAPGNHDIDRSRSDFIRDAVRQVLNQENSREKVRDLLLNEKELSVLLEPQQAYFEFFADTFDQIELTSPCRHYVHKLSVPERGNITIVGLNSSWAAYGGDEDRGRLLLGEPQIITAFERCSEDDLVISLLHHPFDWLNPNNVDTEYCKSALIEKSDVILNGHIHATNLISASSLEGSTVFIPAGAIFTDRNAPLSYNYASVDLDSGNGTIFFRRYSSTRQRWIKDIESTGDLADGKGSFTVKALPVSAIEVAPANRITQRTIITGDDDEEGLLDWMVGAMDASDGLMELMQELEKSGQTWHAKVIVVTQQFNVKRQNPRQIQQAVKQIAAATDEFAHEIDRIATELGTQWKVLYQASRPFVSLESEDLKRWISMSADEDSYTEQAIGFAANIEAFNGQLDTMKNDITQLQAQVAQLRGIHRSLNKAVRKIDQAFEHFQTLLDQMKSDAGDLLHLSRKLPAMLTESAAEALEAEQ